MTIYAADVVKRVLDSLDAEAVLKKINYRPTTIQKRDDQLRCFCPIHKETVFRTLVVQCNDNRYRCSYTLCAGARGGDLIDLYALSAGMDYDDAMRDLAASFNLTIELPSISDFLEQKMSEGRNYLDMGAGQEARETYSQILAADPDNLDAHQGLLQALILTGKSREAKEQRLRIAQIAQKQGNWTVAQQTYEEHLEEDPDDDLIRDCLIQIYEEQGLQENLVAQYMAMAERYEALGQVDEALRMYREVEKHGAAIIDVFPHVVRLLREAGRRSDAVAEYLKQAVKLETEGYADLALEQLAEALSLDPERHDIRMKAITGAAAGTMSAELTSQALEWVDGYLERHLYSDALEALEILKPRLPRDRSVEDRMLKALEAQGKLTQAESFLGRIIEEWTGGGDLQAALKRLEEMLRERPRSLDLARRKAALLAEMKDMEGAADTYRSLLDQLIQAQELRKAREIFEEVLAIRPGDLPLRERYRQTLIQLGLIEEAQKVSLNLADRYMEVNRGEEALERL